MEINQKYIEIFNTIKETPNLKYIEKNEEIITVLLSEDFTINLINLLAKFQYGLLS